VHRPPAPPSRGPHQRTNPDPRRETARPLNRHPPRHGRRIDNTNNAGHPSTTAPALGVKDGITLAQGLLTYTPAGATVDLEVGKALDIAVETDETETSRDPDAMRWNRNTYARVSIDFNASITNRKPHPVTVEITKLAFGNADTVSQGGEKRALSIFDADHSTGFIGRPWWLTYAWPWYWSSLNGAAEYTWTIELNPSETATLQASWHYLWN